MNFENHLPNNNETTPVPEATTELNEIIEKEIPEPRVIAQALGIEDITEEVEERIEALSSDELSRLILLIDDPALLSTSDHEKINETKQHLIS